MKTSYKRELNHTILVVEVEGHYEEDYQMRMLRENPIRGILPVYGRGEDDNTIYEYEVSGMQALKSVHEKKKIREKEMKTFLIQLSNTIEQVKNHLLDVNGIMLNPEYVFYDTQKEEFNFCYYPGEKLDLWSAFHKLTEYFVQQTDYQDIAGVKIAFMLHKETMQENYSLKDLIDKMEQESVTPVYERAEHDWITEQEMGSTIMEETENLWTPVRKFLQRHKKPKWGEWDGIYIDEEEL